MVEGYLDPCGEFEGNQQGMVWHDGGLPKSAAVHHREIFNVKFPEQTEVGNSLNTATWSLTCWQLPLAENPIILVAHETSALTTEELSSVRDVLDGGTIPTYPDWTRVGEQSVWICRKKLAVFKNTTIKEQAKKWRISNQGITLSFNAPDIVNQGLVYAGQWANDYQDIEISTDIDTDKPEVANAVVRAWTSTGGWQGVLNFPAWLKPVSQGSGNNWYSITQEGEFWQARTNGAANPPAGTTAYSPVAEAQTTSLDSQFQITTDGVTHTYQGSVWVRAGRTSPGASTSIWTRFVEWSDTEDFAEVRNRISVLDSSEPKTDAAVPVEYASVIEISRAQDSSKLTLPIPDPDVMLQGNPQFFFMQAKVSQGVYMPLRMMQPVASLQDGDNYRTMVFALDGAFTSRSYSGLRDSVDRNFAVGAMLISDVSKAATLVIKFMRTIEVDPGQAGVWQAFAEKTPDVNPALLTIVKTVQNSHPHAYPATYNGFGTLFGIVQGLINKIPIVGDLAGSVSQLLPQLLGAVTGSKPSPGQASNEELLHMLLQQLPTLLNSMRL